MEQHPITVEKLFMSPASEVWSAISDNNEMKKWYFDLAEFKPEVGFTFSFTGGPSPEKQYVHLCEVTEVIPEKILAYSWSYEGLGGKSFVTFELFDQETMTLLRLTHSELETFPQDNPDFAVSNFVEGWNEIVCVSLRKYLEEKR